MMDKKKPFEMKWLREENRKKEFPIFNLNQYKKNWDENKNKEIPIFNLKKYMKNKK